MKAILQLRSLINSGICQRLNWFGHPLLGLPRHLALIKDAIDRNPKPPLLPLIKEIKDIAQQALATHPKPAWLRFFRAPRARITQLTYEFLATTELNEIIQYFENDKKISTYLQAAHAVIHQDEVDMQATLSTAHETVNDAAARLIEEAGGIRLIGRTNLSQYRLFRKQRPLPAPPKPAEPRPLYNALCCVPKAMSPITPPSETDRIKRLFMADKSTRTRYDSEDSDASLSPRNAAPTRSMAPGPLLQAYYKHCKERDMPHSP